MKSWSFFALFNIVLITTIYAEDDTIKDRLEKGFVDLDDSVTEVEEGKLTLYFFNALNGHGIKDAEVKIKGVGSFLTDVEGRVFFPIPKDYQYKVEFKKKGYIDSEFAIKIEAGTIFDNRRFSISPEMDLKQFRVVLDWGKHPKDLDAHFVKSDAYHISYRDMKTLEDRKARLDRDDMDSFGPETITVEEISKNSKYTYYVHDYTNGNKDNTKAMSDSRATVKVYGNSKLLHVFQIPRGVVGIYWEIFNIENGQISVQNEIGNNLRN